MLSGTDLAFPELLSADVGYLEVPEPESLVRLSNVVARLFHVPVAYIALLGADERVANRVGVYGDLWQSLRTYPLARVLSGPILWPDPSGDPVPGFVPGEVRFTAAAPLRSTEGLDLGLLVIADTMPHAEFTSEDLGTLAELAGVLASKMELRMLLSQACEAQQPATESEKRFQNIATYAPVMIICSGVDGGVWFVNKAWLEFTGRTLEDELGSSYTEAFHPDYRERVVESYWDAFAARRPRTIRLPMLRHGGEYRLVEARGAPRFFEDGTFAGFVECYIDLGAWEEPSCSPGGRD